MKAKHQRLTLALSAVVVAALLAKHDETYMPPQVAGAMPETRTLAP